MWWTRRVARTELRYYTHIMPKRDNLDPNSQGYTNAILEDVDDKFQIILEATKPISRMQQNIARILTWEEDVKLIPAIFQEVGKLRQDVEVIKQALEILGMQSKRLENIEQRLRVVEHSVK